LGPRAPIPRAPDQPLAEPQPTRIFAVPGPPPPAFPRGEVVKGTETAPPPCFQGFSRTKNVRSQFFGGRKNNGSKGELQRSLSNQQVFLCSPAAVALPGAGGHFDPSQGLSVSHTCAAAFGKAPGFPRYQWKREVGEALPDGVGLHVVDAHNVVPCWLAPGAVRRAGTRPLACPQSDTMTPTHPPAPTHTHTHHTHTRTYILTQKMHTPAHAHIFPNTHTHARTRTYTHTHTHKHTHTQRRRWC